MIAPAGFKVAPERSAPAWNPPLDEFTARPFCLIVPAGLKRAEPLTSRVPAT